MVDPNERRMDYDEMTRKVLEIFPYAQIDEDFDGQIVVNTNTVMNKHNMVVNMGDTHEGSD